MFPFRAGLLVLCSFSGLSGIAAEAIERLEPNFLFSDNMVLQRGGKAPVWGKAPAGTRVSVAFRGKTVDAITDASGSWSTEVEPGVAGGPFDLTFATPAETKTIRNVMVGDVWFCSGQSNMWWSVSQSKDGAKEVLLATHPRIRLLTIPLESAAVPKSNLPGIAWAECSPESVKQFSAVAYYFGRSMLAHNDVPVGLINSSWGGSAVQSWTSLGSLETNPDLVGITGQYYSAVRRFDKDLAAGIVDERDAYVDKGLQQSEKGMEAVALDDNGWKSWDLPGRFGEYGKPEYLQGAIWFRKMVDIPPEWAGKELVLGLGAIGNYDITYFNGVEVGRTEKAHLAADKKRSNREYLIPVNLVKPGPALVAVRNFNAIGSGGIQGFAEWLKRPIALALKEDKKATVPLTGKWKYKVSVPLAPRGLNVDPGSHKLPSSCFNGMVAPVIPFAIRGILWYQGEANTHNAWEYAAQLPLLIRSWREAWKRQIPFLYVQLPGLGSPSAGPADDSQYNESWNELRDAQWKGLTEPATAMVAAIDLGEASIHPANKQDVGARLALAARALALGEKVEYSGPLYAGMTVEGDKVRVRFTHTGSGLVAKDDGELQKFAVAGEDRKYVWAKAKIEGDSVVVWSEQVPKPVAVSYAWAMNPAGCNLYNREGLPAAPFRSDKWPMRTYGRKAPY